jgi:NAD(P)-dependent dehydrogenase (short-subunit alcohol dehydrogenase family)
MAARSKAISEISDEEWQHACKAIIRTTLYCLQAAATHMRGGSILVIGPSFSFCGAAGLVPLSAAAEAQRGLMKSAARQLGERGFSVNWIAAASVAWSPMFAHASLPFRPERVPIALGRRPDLASEIVPIIDFLGSHEGRSITGASLSLDGGEWMLP